jgi:hypothetical protein
MTPSEVISKIVEKILELVKLSPKYLMAIILATGILLFAKREHMVSLGLADFIDSYRPWISIVFLLSASLFVSYPLSFIASVGYKWFYKRLETHRSKKRLLIWLDNLTPVQKDILRGYIDKETRTMHLRIDNGVVRELEAAKIIGQATQFVDNAFCSDYTINTWVYQYLKKHPEIIR